MPRLRPLSEAECYARLYGDWEQSVTVVPPRRQRPPGRLTGEELRRLFEERLDAREPDALDTEAA